MKYLKTIYGLFLLASLSLISCEEDNPSLGPIITPSDISVDYEIFGQDDNNPFGDGSGVVSFSANANNAITYKIVSGNIEKVSSSGNATITFTA